MVQPLPTDMTKHHELDHVSNSRFMSSQQTRIVVFIFDFGRAVIMPLCPLANSELQSTSIDSDSTLVSSAIACFHDVYNIVFSLHG